jgi:hypothetical protein
MSLYTDHLAEYLSADEHELHAMFANLVAAFHAARADAKKMRAGDQVEAALERDMRAERFARVIENLTWSRL